MILSPGFRVRVSIAAGCSEARCWRTFAKDHVILTQGIDFTVAQRCALTDLDALDLGAQRSNLGDRYEIQVQVAVNRLAPGSINGFIRIKTNDPDFPVLNVPVKGSVE